MASDIATAAAVVAVDAAVEADAETLSGSS